GEAEKELLLNNLMLALIYWIPFAEVFEEEGGNNESGQVKAIAGVLQMILPYLREPEHSAFASLCAAYMAHSS
ncbi:MAG TPA: hypothetical protein VI566_12280, partial [Xanthomonadales bacterium]|nr:hypothetical protein [Xanthomonadales bacterium]